VWFVRVQRAGPVGERGAAARASAARP
jgi:hypothetical protein